MTDILSSNKKKIYEQDYIHAKFNEDYQFAYKGSGNIHVPLSKFGISYGHAVRMKMSTLCCSWRDAVLVAMECWTPAHRAFVHTMFADKIISRYGDIPWSARSPDLSSCNFFLWGYFKSRIFATHIPDLQTLKARIQEEVKAIPYRILASVMDNFVRRLRECISHNGGYLPGVNFKK
jgi:hypothetical protein